MYLTYLMELSIIFIYIELMRVFERYFQIETSLDQIDKYVRLVLKTFDPDDDIEVTYEDQQEAQFIRIKIFDRTLN